ncbi:hypothetical protein PR202_ga14261 [Eleusine coracana subsp. coracana]|uniref:Rab-GAP TBC domain-containing protein n=1 Tax=Eleusine coracana subsp. coracana TaxID=191504 RepID=A0AAV5CH29_ELECO|nr:hypothetical protein PR202_ga14261 [Eleusine coracana subsp. coracana]
MMGWGSSGQAADSFYQVRSDCSHNVQDPTGPRSMRLPGHGFCSKPHTERGTVPCPSHIPYPNPPIFSEYPGINNRNTRLTGSSQHAIKMQSGRGGMSDLCSPMIVLLNDEADAFWCFERLMRRLRGNFRCTQQSVGVENQLQHLSSIIQVLDPKLHDHLGTLGGGDYLFAFRMFMVLFRRELSFEDSLFLWEMMWALEYDPDIFSTYEETGAATSKTGGFKSKGKSIRQFGKYERENMKNGAHEDDGPVPISVFLVASVLKENSPKLLQEARGIDDVIRVSWMDTFLSLKSLFTPLVLNRNA